MSRNTQIGPLNLAVLVGTLTRPPRFKSFDSSRSITSLDIKVRRDEKTTDVVRVTWFDAPPSALELEEGETIAVCGRVRRFWFGGNQSVTDVVADKVIVGASAAKTRRALLGVVQTIEDAVA